MSADLEFKQLIDRILRCREAEDDAKQDTKEIYAELKSRGYDKTAAGALVAEIRKKDKNPDKFEERNTILDLYREAYERASGTRLATHTHTPDPQVSGDDDGRPSIPSSDHAGAKNASPSPLSHGRAPEEGEVHCRKSEQESDSAAQVGNKAESASGSSVTHSPSTGFSSLPSSIAGEVGQSSPISPAFSKTIRDYRPFCQKLEACGASGLRHCYACQKIADAAEACEAVA